MEKITIKIAGQDYTIKQSFRSLMLFEEMTNKSVSNMNESIADILKLLYCILKANNQETWKFSFDEFLNIIDEQPEVFTVFSEYLQEQAAGQQPDNKKKPVVRKK